MEKTIIFASDIDGTLSYKREISDRDCRAIDKFRSLGHKFGIATGRNVPGATKLFLHENLHIDFIVCSTGAVILDSKGKVVVKHNVITADTINIVLKQALAHNAIGLAIADENAQYEIKADNDGNFVLPDITRFVHSNIRFADADSAAEFARFINTEYNDRVSAYRNNSGVDLPPAGISKTTGIYEYARVFEDPIIFAAGDNVNDIPMIEEFNGFAVSNACDQLKQIAAHQCDRIADALEAIMNGEV